MRFEEIEDAVRREPGPPARLAEGLLLAAALLLLAGRFAFPGPDAADLPAASELGHHVRVNDAPWYELVNLPGIGETRAREIVRDREENGPFAGVEDLSRIPGIGPVTVARIREYAVEGGR